MRVLTWNLFHGRAVDAPGRPAPNRDLFDSFSARLAGWEWDVALLQECPPWWPVALGRECRAHARMALTSRNQFFFLRRALGRRWPVTMRSGGGCNAILVRGGSVAEHRRCRLRWRPEQRVMHAVRWMPSAACEGSEIGPCGVWIGNLHAQVGSDSAAYRDGDRAARAIRRWAAGGPVILGGDANVRTPRFPGLEHVGGRKVDHVMGRGFEAVGVTEVLERGTLSDHAPLRVTLKRSASTHPA
jgi:Endonuclease/Exonuclease/phosphatase family